MSTRYFYTNPLAAAWMAKHFGMRFFCDKFEPFEYEGTDDILQDMGEDDKACIHPDSLHLLEPMVGDLVFNGGRGYYIKQGTCLLRHKVIQRDGKPFFWPESEPV